MNTEILAYSRLSYPNYYLNLSNHFSNCRLGWGNETQHH